MNADVEMREPRNGTFRATLRGHFEIQTRWTPDPEHDLCFAMVRAGLPDGEIQFWRGTTPALRFKSVHKAARYRVALGNGFPRRVKRRSGENPFGEVGQVAQDGQFDPDPQPDSAEPGDRWLSGDGP